MSIESVYDHLMNDCEADGIDIQDYIDHKIQLRGSRHDPRFMTDMINKVIY